MCNSQATANRNDTINHVKSRVHSRFTSDKSDNSRNYLKSFKPVVYGINYYRYLIECACEVLVNRERLMNRIIQNDINKHPTCQAQGRAGMIARLAGLAGGQAEAEGRLGGGRGEVASVESIHREVPFPTARSFSKMRVNGVSA